MDVEPDMARIARTIGDPTRIRILTLLMDGRALTAKELSYGAGVEPGTGTTHLQRLVADSLIIATAQGRHRYFRLTSPQVAACLEALMVVAKPRSDSAPEIVPPMHLARFCYDHLAGKVAIQITQSLLAQKVLRRHGSEYAVSPKGERWLNQFGLDLASIAASRRKQAYACLDWSERKDHIGGALGAALARHMLQARWITRKSNSRIATITPLGHQQLKSSFGIVCDDGP